MLHSRVLFEMSCRPLISCSRVRERLLGNETSDNNDYALPFILLLYTAMYICHLKRKWVVDDHCVFKSTMYKIAPNIQHYKKFKTKQMIYFRNYSKLMTGSSRLYLRTMQYCSYKHISQSHFQFMWCYFPMKTKSYLILWDVWW